MNGMNGEVSKVHGVTAVLLLSLGLFVGFVLLAVMRAAMDSASANSKEEDEPEKPVVSNNDAKPVVSNDEDMADLPDDFLAFKCPTCGGKITQGVCYCRELSDSFARRTEDK